MSIGGTSKPGHLSPAAIALIVIGAVIIVAMAIGSCGGDDDSGQATPREAAEFIWDKEAEDLQFCDLYWRLPMVEVTEDVFMVRSAGMSDPDAVTTELLNIAARECPQPVGWDESWIESQR